MAFIQWSAVCQTGLPDLDDEHRRLIEIVNRFAAALRRGRSPVVLEGILKDLIGYTQEHFAHEEKLMEEIGFAGSKEHQAEHRRLIQAIERYQFEFGRGRGETTDVRETLRSWLHDHIGSQDRAFAAALLSTISASPVPDDTR